MATDRKAEVTWQGDLMSGNGRIDSVTSGAFGGLDVSWPARSEEPERKDQPGGADRGRARDLLLDGALARARAGRAIRRRS